MSVYPVSVRDRLLCALICCAALFTSTFSSANGNPQVVLAKTAVNESLCRGFGEAAAQVEVIFDPAADTAAGEMSGWLRWGDRETFALVAHAPDQFHILAPNSEGTLRIGELRRDGLALAGSLRVGYASCRAGEFSLSAGAQLPVSQFSPRRDRAALLFAIDRAIAQVEEVASSDLPQLPELMQDLSSRLEALLGSNHPRTIAARTAVAHGLLLAQRPGEALQLLAELEPAATRALGSTDTLLLHLSLVRLLAQGESNRGTEVLRLGDELGSRAQAELGDKHLARWQIGAAVASLHLQHRSYGRAGDLAESADRALSSLLGDVHRETLRNRATLAAVRYVQHRGKEALVILEPMLASARLRFRDDDRLSLRVADLVARCHFQLGRWREGLPIAERVHALASRSLPSGDQLRRYATTLLATWYMELGRYTDAELLFRDALASGIKHVGENHPSIPETRAQLAMLLLATDRAAAAYAQADSAFRQVRGWAGDDNHRTIWIRGIRAQALDRLGRTAEALGEARATMAGYQRLYGQDALHAAYAMIIAGRSESLLGRHEDAANTLGEAVRRQTSARPYDHPGRIEALGELAIAYRRGGRMDDAIAAWEEVVEEAERLRDGVGPLAEDRQGFLRHWSPHYRRLVDARARRQEYERTFELAEMIKGRTLLEMLSARLADGAGLIAEDETRQLAELIAEMSRQDQTLGGLPSSGPDRAAALQARSEAARALRSFREDLAARYPKYAQLMRIKLRTIRDAPEIIPDDAAFVSYLVLEDRVLALLYTRESGLQVRQASFRGQLGELVRAYRNLLSPAGPDTREPVWLLPDGTIRLSHVRPEPNARTLVSAKPVALALRRLLLDPIAPLLANKRRWILSLDDALALVPFEALPWKGARVIDRHEVSYIQSLSVLALLGERARPRDAAGSILAMGSPDYGTDPEVRRDAAGDGASPRGPILPHELQLRDRRWQPLPGAAREIAAAAAWFAPEQRDIYLGRAASEGTLRGLDRNRRLLGYRYLLFATHAWLNTEVPQLSSVVLSQRPRTAEADGYVTSAEWVGFQLDSELIVLSGCETALGATVRGEGITGLPFALLVAGNRNAVLSLWKIDDRAASQLIPRLFHHLQRGHRPAKALTLAKRELARDQRYAAPHFWAAFVLYGG